uniref:Uncharacterized protein n=1 Tax=Psilocybe cubensis TaxID=181762 RepID=A0A8H8CPY0_PSICU
MTPTSANPMQIFLITGDGMMLSKTSSNGSFAQTPTFYASFTNNSQSIVTRSAPAPAGSDTKFVIQITRSGPSSRGDDICYLASVMTADLTDQFWTVDDLQNNDHVKADTIKSAKNWVFIPSPPNPGPQIKVLSTGIMNLIAGNYVIFAEDPSGTNAASNGRSNFAVTCPLSSGGDISITTLLAASNPSPTQVWLVTGDGMILSRTSSTGSLAQTPTYYASFTGNSQNIVTTLAPATPAPDTKFVIQIMQVAGSDHGDTLTYLGTVMTADLTDQFWTVDDLKNNDAVKADTSKSAKKWVFVPI